MPPQQHHAEFGVGEGSGLISWCDIQTATGMLRDRLAGCRATRIAAEVHTGGQLVTTLLAARALEVDVVLCGPRDTDEAVAELQPDFRISTDPRNPSSAMLQGPLREPGNRRAAAVRAGLWVFSSGTTGSPKATHWNWDEMTRGAKWQPEVQNERWGIGYAPFTFSGVSATCQALGRAQLLLYLTPGDLGRPGRAFEALDVVAATPSFWRMASILKQRNQLGARPIRTVCMTGEPVDQSLLDMIRSSFSPDRIRQLFGSTELGAILSVDDEKAGIPRKMLNRRLPGGPELQVRGDLLVVSKRPGDPFLPTGDQVEVTADRIYIRGRTANSINVGGLKVDPVIVSHVMQQYPGVLAARAYAVHSQVTGSVVGVDVVLDGSRDPEEMIMELKRHAKSTLQPHQSPRRIRIVDNLPVDPSGKLRVDE
jgi:acyl-coenzyme A synthetase/AMP-(fatty) acid ligase